MVRGSCAVQISRVKTMYTALELCSVYQIKKLQALNLKICQLWKYGKAATANM